MANVAYFTVFQGIDVAANPVSKFRDREFGPAVELSYPGREWDEVRVYKPYATHDEAKAAAKAIADSLKKLQPKGSVGFLNLRLSAKSPELVAARDRVESIVREWAGEGSVIHEVGA